MSTWFGRLWRRIKFRHFERELAEELEVHARLAEDDLRASGLAASEAARRARRSLGNVTYMREEARAVWLGPSIESVWQDARHAARSLRARPGLTLAACGMLAVGIGMTTAMFTLVDALVLRPVPFHAPQHLAQIYMGSEHGGRLTVAPSVLRAWRESRAFQEAESATADTALVEVGGTFVARGIARVTPHLFDLLGDVRPLRGRLFDKGDGRAGSDDRVLISEDLWRGLYDGDPAIVGRSVTIDGDRLTVVGILPSAFRFPAWNTVIWRPIDFDAPPPSRAKDQPRVYVRFRATMPRADALRIATEVARTADGANARLRARVEPVAGAVLDTYYGRAVPLLAGGVVLVFLVLAANVCSLLLARLTERRREFGISAALGASRSRLIRRALVESTIVGLLGVLWGLGVAWALVRVARTFLPEAFLLHTLHPLAIDLRALGVTCASGVVATIATGVLPAWMATRVGAAGSLRVTDRGATETRGARALTRALLVVEIAFACTLLAGATLLVRSFINLARADRGLDASGVLTATMSLPRAAFPDASARTIAARSLEEQVRTLPGVQQVAWSYGLPPDGGALSFGKWKSDAPGGRPVDMDVDRYSVGRDFFALYGIPIVRGRAFSASDSPGTVVVGDRLARSLWPGLDPIGRTFTFQDEVFHVVGVAREIHHPSLDASNDRPEFYEPFPGVGGYAMMSIRCGDACPDTALLRHRIGAAHPAVHVEEIRALEDVYFEQLARPRAAAALAFAFAAVALVAVAGGLFSVLSYAVGRRRREFGIRTALGASPRQVRRAVLGDSLRVVLAGVAVGTLAAVALARGLASLEYGVAMADPLSWSVVFGVIALTALAASWRPARNATRVDPVLLLREE